LRTEIKTVLSIDTRGTISMSCWVAMSSSSEGAIEVLSEVGRDMILRWDELFVKAMFDQIRSG